jgi:phosphomannomutase/phosphoglucomutase
LGSEINLNGFTLLGEALGTQLVEMEITPAIIVGHDYRSYSQSVKNALIIGLMNAGIHVHDIGLCTSPMAYFAQFHLDIPAVAMVTASHNENGWTGVKIGTDRPLTHGPEDMARLRDITLNRLMVTPGGGQHHKHEGIAEAYIDDLTKGIKLTQPLKVVCACGNGTPGAYAPEVLRRIGCEVIEETCELDHGFPNYNPNPEDLVMLNALSKAVEEHGADIGLAFDGDGDRCGVVDNEGEEIFADKMGVIMARWFAKKHDAPLFIADVKSTGLFMTDEELLNLGARTEYWKTGHSYMKRHVYDRGALAGFEKSGHYFLNQPLGRGYDDGLLTAVLICQLLEDVGNQTMADLRRSLPMTWSLHLDTPLPRGSVLQPGLYGYPIQMFGLLRQANLRQWRMPPCHRPWWQLTWPRQALPILAQMAVLVPIQIMITLCLHPSQHNLQDRLTYYGGTQNLKPAGYQNCRWHSLQRKGQRQVG